MKVDDLPRRVGTRSSNPPSRGKVCIIGAGIAGLYTALMLDHLGVDYDILEASERPGGRIRTHHFSEAPHDYYDAGAMRFPDIPQMERTFDLFRRTGVDLIDYNVQGQGTPKHYNGKTAFGNNHHQDDSFRVGVESGGDVPQLSAQSQDQIMKRALEPLKQIMKKADHVSYDFYKEWECTTVREYVANTLDLDFHTVQWIEDNDRGTATFDMSMAEYVTEALAFKFDTKAETSWKSINGGSEKLIDALITRMVSVEPMYDQVVTRLALDRNATEDSKMVVESNHGEVRRYSTVFCTSTLGALQRMDLQDLGLPHALKTAIRALRYDNATKVAIKFSNPWWEDVGINNGGAAQTDMPMRTCIYPTRVKGSTMSAVLLCSFAWGQDATRIGSLLNSQNPKAQDMLHNILLRDLAKLHSTPGSFDEIYNLIKSSYVDCHGYDWSHDEYAAGGVARFSAGQFRNFYPYLVQPHADSRFHIIGEATSTSHAWIAGSLESAYRGVWLFLERSKAFDLQQVLRQEFGSIPELETGDDGVAHLLVQLGMNDEQTEDLAFQRSDAVCSAITIKHSTDHDTVKEQLKEGLKDAYITFIDQILTMCGLLNASVRPLKDGCLKAPDFHHLRATEVWGLSLSIFVLALIGGISAM